MEAEMTFIILETNYSTISHIIFIFINKAMRNTKFHKIYISSIYEHNGSKTLEPEVMLKYFPAHCL